MPRNGSPGSAHLCGKCESRNGCARVVGNLDINLGLRPLLILSDPEVRCAGQDVLTETTLVLRMGFRRHLPFRLDRRDGRSWRRLHLERPVSNDKKIAPLFYFGVGDCPTLTQPSILPDSPVHAGNVNVANFFKVVCTNDQGGGMRPSRCRRWSACGVP